MDHSYPVVLNEMSQFSILIVDKNCAIWLHSPVFNVLTKDLIQKSQKKQPWWYSLTYSYLKGVESWLMFWTISNLFKTPSPGKHIGIWYFVLILLHFPCLIMMDNETISLKNVKTRGKEWPLMEKRDRQMASDLTDKRWSPNVLLDILDISC